MPEAKHNWNVPNWRNSGAYPKVNEIPDALWHWEFLRRNPEYRNDWLTWKHNRKFGDQYEPDDPLFRAVMPDCIETYGLDSLINPTVNRPLNLEFSPTFGVTALPVGNDPFPHLDPEIKAELELEAWEIPLTIETDLSSDVYKWPICRRRKPVPGTSFDFRFDLAQSWKIQVQVAKTAFEQFRQLCGLDPKQRRAQRQRWPNYLRILDARNDGETYAAIGKEIFAIDDDSAAAAQAKHRHTAARALSKHFPFVSAGD